MTDAGPAQHGMQDAPADPGRFEHFLRGAVRTMPGAHFAIVDGALYDALPALLAQHGLSGQSLFRTAEGGTAGLDGPVLIPVIGDGALAALAHVAAAGGRSPVVWSWPGKPDALWRHLRTINLATIPREQPQGAALPVDPGAAPVPLHETVVFRHWDGNVLEPLWPLLTPAQRARIIGKAGGIAWQSDEFDATRAVGAAPPVEPDAGFLRLTAEQMRHLSDARLSASHRSIARYLRKTEPEATAHVDEPGLLAFVRRADDLGRQLGISSERAHGLWAWLIIVTGGAAATAPEIRRAFEESGASGDETVEAIVDGMIARERAESRGP